MCRHRSVLGMQYMQSCSSTLMSWLSWTELIEHECTYCTTLHTTVYGEPWAGALVHYSMLVEWIFMTSQIAESCVPEDLLGSAKMESTRVSALTRILTWLCVTFIVDYFCFWNGIFVILMLCNVSMHQLISSCCSSTVYTSTVCISSVSSAALSSQLTAWLY